MDVKYPGTTKWERLTYQDAERGNSIAKATPRAINDMASRVQLPVVPAGPPTPTPLQPGTPAQAGTSTRAGTAPTRPGEEAMEDEDEVWA